jgi:hypothetical protein
MRYWLSVGAEPTRQVQHILERYDFVPKRPHPYGSQHFYEKKEKPVGMQFWMGMKNTSRSSLNRVDLYYRQLLQE